MPRANRVILLKQIKHDGKWIPAPALFDSKGRVRRDHVRVKGKDEVHPEGGYFIEWRVQGKRVKEAAEPDAFTAAELARRHTAWQSRRVEPVDFRQFDGLRLSTSMSEIALERANPFLELLSLHCDHAGLMEGVS
jgi:hypothetical protein